MLRAATGKVNLAILGSSATAAVALHSAPLLAVGGLAYMALVVWDLVGAQEPPPPPPPAGPPPLPAVEGWSAPGAREALLAMHRGRAALDKALADTPDTVRGTLGEAVRAARELEAHAGVLLSRAEDLHVYLSAQNRHEVDAEIARLGALSAGARDAETAAEYGRARNTREEQAKNLDEIAAARDRALAHLSRIAAALEGLAPRIVRMNAQDDVTRDRVRGEVGDDLARLNQEVGLFEVTLRDLGGMSK